MFSFISVKFLPPEALARPFFTTDIVVSSQWFRIYFRKCQTLENVGMLLFSQDLFFKKMVMPMLCHKTDENNQTVPKLLPVLMFFLI